MEKGQNSTEFQQNATKPGHLVIVDDEFDIAKPLAEFFRGYNFQTDFKKLKIFSCY